MYLSSTSEIRVETSGYDVSYVLPVRPLGKLRWLGLILVGFSVLFISGPAKGVFETIERFARTQQAGFEILAFAVQLFLVVGGSFPGFFGMLAIFGCCRVDWRNQRLSGVECLGPFRWRRRMPRESIRKLRVDFGRDSEDNRPLTEGPFANLGVLWAEFERSKPRMVILGYPRDWLQSLAADLSMRVGASATVVGAPKVEVVDAAAPGPEFADVAEKPAGSRLNLESRANGLLLAVPPAGLWRGSKGLLVFGLIWCSIMGLITGLSISINHKNSAGMPWLVILIFGAFWLIGMSVVTGAINMGCRRATVSVESGTLRVAQISLFGTKDWAWRRGEIAAIRADASGMAVNDVPIIELQVHPLTGKKAGFFAGRDEQELRWLATELRRALSVPARVSETSERT